MLGTSSKFLHHQRTGKQSKVLCSYHYHHDTKFKGLFGVDYCAYMFKGIGFGDMLLHSMIDKQHLKEPIDVNDEFCHPPLDKDFAIF